MRNHPIPQRGNRPSRRRRRWRKHRRFDIKRHTCREIPGPNAASGRKKEVRRIEKKKYELYLRLNQQEAEILRANAKEYGMTQTAYLRSVLKSVVPPKHPTEEIDKLRTEVHAIGNNINQIARKYNAGFGTPEDARMIQFLMEKVYCLMYEIARQK